MGLPSDAPADRRSEASLSDHVSIEAPATHDGVACLRDAIAAFAGRRGAATDLLERIQLVVSELGTNVVLHTGKPDICVEAEVLTDRVVVTVEPGPASLPSRDQRVPPAEPAGRGLIIVQRAADSVRLLPSTSADRSAGAVECTFSR